MKNLLILAALLLLGNFSANMMAQTPESTPKTIAVPQTKGVQNIPYSAEGISETVQTLVDGNKIKTTSKRRSYRDSQGRTRNEFESYFADKTTLSISIFDPVDGFRYQLNPERKTAIRTPLNSRVNSVVALPKTWISSKFEDLGTKVIDGFEATGTRSISMIAPGTFGNEKEIVTVGENWFSPELKVTIYFKNNDPRNGEQIFQLKNIKREEPDPSLFKVPSDYKIVDRETLSALTTNPEM